MHRSKQKQNTCPLYVGCILWRKETCADWFWWIHLNNMELMKSTRCTISMRCKQMNAFSICLFSDVLKLIQYKWKVVQSGRNMHSSTKHFIFLKNQIATNYGCQFRFSDRDHKLWQRCCLKWIEKSIVTQYYYRAINSHHKSYGINW